MCGICGIARFNTSGSTAQDDQHRDIVAVKGMLQTMQHRGPDDGGHHQKNAVTLGHRRLSIIDLSAKGHQPMVAGDLSLVFNGCIYNYRALRQELLELGYSFASESDTEVILVGYMAWGVQLLPRLDGMFAFAIHDARRNSLLLARDRVGIKPLYYALVNQQLCFASTSQALLTHPAVDRSISPEALQLMFSLHAVVTSPDTIIRGVKKLQQGHYVQLDLGNPLSDAQMQPVRYWHINADETLNEYSDAQWLEQTEHYLRLAVRKRLEAADVPVGVLLSGGLDSSILTWLLAEESGQQFDTYSIGFEDSATEKGSEFDLSDQVAARFDTRHHKYSISNAEALSRLPEIFTKLSEPMFAQDAIGFYLLSEQVSKHNKVVLSGQGADEVFAGYFWYPQMHRAEGSDFERFAPFYFDRDFTEMCDMFNSDYLLGNRDIAKSTIQQKLANIQGSSFINRVLALDATELVTEDPVRRVDNMTMAWSLESRVPFLDYQLIELAVQMPPRLKLALQGKGILRQLSRHKIPDAVIDKPKGYFPMPALKYVKGGFYQMMKDALNSQACRQRGIYNPAYINRLLDEPEQHYTAIQGSKLWHVAQFELWLQANL